MLSFFIKGAFIMRPTLTVLHFDNEGEGVALDPISFPSIQFLNLRVSYETRNEVTLMHSLAATPARYIEAAVAKALSLGVKTDILVFNPQIQTEELLIQETLDRCLECASNTVCMVFTDLKDYPIAYLFPAALISDLNAIKLERIRFLSNSSSSLDASYLSTAFGERSQLVVIRIRCTLNSSAGFFNNQINECMKGIYNLTTLHATRAYSAVSLSDRPKKTIAVMPYHAGDLLFFLKAMEGVSHPFNCLLINCEFVDIAKKIAPKLELIPILECAPNRSLNADPDLTSHGNLEYRYFQDIVYKYIPEDAAFYFFRPSRDYNLCKFHMIDQWKFSLTNDNFPLINEISFNAPKLPLKSRSALLHFDGGWPLKIYPSNLQHRLISLLQQNGFEVKVISNGLLEYNCPTIQFQGLNSLQDEILRHAVLIGMDSFPAHYSTYIINHPTICLFGSTHPSNSNAPKSNRYQFLSKSFDCAPCFHNNYCRRFYSDHCNNFIDPEEACAAVESMYKTCYGEYA